MENYFHREFSPIDHDQDMWVDDNDYVGEHDDDDDGNNSDHDHFHYMEQEARREEGDEGCEAEDCYLDEYDDEMGDQPGQ